MATLDGRCALVTGGGSGIGLATVRRLRSEGARVVVVDRDPSTGKAAASEVEGTFVQADVGDAGGVADAFRAAYDALDGLDLVHLNAGVVTGIGDIAQLTDAQYERIRSVNLDGVVFGCREAVRTMSEGGSIVVTASLAGMVAYPGDPIYALTKHGVVGLVRGLGPQLEPRGITVNAVCPGIVETPLVGDDNVKQLKDAGFPLLTPDDIAEAVVRAVTGGGTGECWVCQPGREPLVYGFRGVPGPRIEGAEGMEPPVFGR